MEVIPKQDPTHNHPLFKDISGQRFKRLLVLNQAGTDKEGKAVWNCICDCGKPVVVMGRYLRRGLTTSCGCLGRENCLKSRTTHGFTAGDFSRNRPREYQTWCGMTERCENPKSKAFKSYGGRGIKICERWRNSFENFFSDMGPCPEKFSIDRINNDGNYEPKNCRWASVHQQTRNRRSTINVTLFGKTQCLTDWANELGVGVIIINYKRRKGMTPTEAVMSVASKLGYEPPQS